jgi:chorismate--pyruvate lyase
VRAFKKFNLWRHKVYKCQNENCWPANDIVADSRALLYHAGRDARSGGAHRFQPSGVQGLHPPSLLFQRDLPWRDARRTHPAAPARSWLFEPGSLTARLRALAGKGVGVRLLTQDRRRPFPSEAALLDLTEHRLALVREVVLHTGGTALVLARTIIPPQALRGVYHGFAHLGERPLGELLFANPRLKRSRLELARIGGAGWRLEAARDYGIVAPVWGRRSLYEIDEASLLVCEFFLPALLNFPESGA